MTLMACAFLDGGGKARRAQRVLICQPGRKWRRGRGCGRGCVPRGVAVGVGFGPRNVWRWVKVEWCHRRSSTICKALEAVGWALRGPCKEQMHPCTHALVLVSVLMLAVPLLPPWDRTTPPLPCSIVSYLLDSTFGIGEREGMGVSGGVWVVGLVMIGFATPTPHEDSRGKDQRVWGPGEGRVPRACRLALRFVRVANLRGVTGVRSAPHHRARARTFSITIAVVNVDKKKQRQHQS